MDTPLAYFRVPRRAPLSALEKLTIAPLFGFAGLLAYAQLVLVGEFALDQTILAGLILMVAAFVAAGGRWTPLLGALLSALVLLGNPQIVIHDLAHPESFRFFVSMVVAVALSTVGLVAGISATVQNYRSAERRTPRGLVPALAGLVALCLGAILVAAIPREASTSVSPAVLAGLPAIHHR